LQYNFLCHIGILIPKLSSRTIKQAVGLVGCVIAPHNVFLHSALVQSRKIDPGKEYEVREVLRYYSIESTMALVVPFMKRFCKRILWYRRRGNLGLENAGKYLQEKFGDIISLSFIFGVLGC